jgi:hypothetical protein
MNESQLDCKNNVFNNKDSIFADCIECPQECDSVSYEISTTFSQYPGRRYAEKLIQNSFLNKTFTDVKSNMSVLRESILSFGVYYSELKYTEIDQLEKQSIIEFVCNLGGTFGLFIGASVLSFIEILEGIIAVVLVLMRN